MAPGFTFAVQAMGFGDRESLLATARAAETLGYSELYTADHVGLADPLLPLIVAAESTTRLRFGPLVLNNELHHPALLARSIATADHMTGGRLILGMGTGYMRAEHDATGIELREPADRIDRLEESLVILRSLLDNGSASHAGTHHRIELEDLGIRPAQRRVPILLGGNGRKVIGVGARLADVFQFTGLTFGPGGTPDNAGFALATVRDQCRWLNDAARDRSDRVVRSALVQRTAIGEGADDRIRTLVDDRGLDPTLIAETPFLMMGSEEQVVDKIERLREELAITHFVVREPEEFAPIVERFAQA